MDSLTNKIEPSHHELRVSHHHPHSAAIPPHAILQRQEPAAAECTAPVLELADPFHAEVLLDGQPVATLTDRVFTEMFWRDYKITPLTPEVADMVMNDDLWDNCRFTFRDPTSGQVCRTAFCGGSRPYEREGVISLRALYFSDASSQDNPSKKHFIIP